MNQTELQQILTDFAADRVSLLERHEAGARAVSHYDFNNAYQYVINREETHLAWLQSALGEFPAAFPGASTKIGVPPQYRTALAGETNVTSGMTTSVSGATPASSRATCSAEVPLFIATAHRAPVADASSRSNRSTKGPT